MDHTLKYIIHEVTTKAKNGIAVINNFSGEREVDFATFADIKAQGFDSVEAKLSDIISNTRNELTLYLKRKSGSSNVYRTDTAKEKFKAVLKPLNNTNTDVSKDVVASSGNSGDATTSYQQPTIQPIMEQQQQPTVGLMGGLNQAQIQTYDIYAKADKYVETKESLTNALQSAQTIEDKYKLLDRDHLDRGYEIRDLKKEITALKETHTKELAEASRPFVSEGNLEMAQGFGAMIIGAVEKFAPVKVGLTGAEPQHQQPQEQFSEIKTKLLNFVKNEGFDDGYCQLFFDIMNQSIESAETVAELQKLIN